MRDRSPALSWFGFILGINVLLMTAINAVRPMVTYRALDLGAGPLEIGLLAASFAALSLPLGAPIGRWVDRVGESRVAAVGIALVAVVSMATIWIDSIALLVVSQAVFGLGQILYVVSAQTMVANRSVEGARDGRFGMFTVFVSGGQLAGPVLVSVVATMTSADGSSFGVIFGLSALVSAIALGLALQLQSSPSHAGSERGGSQASLLSTGGTLLRIPGVPAAIIAGVAVITSVDILVAYLPAFGEATGMPVEVVGLLLAIRAASSLVSRVLMAGAIRMVGRVRLLITSMIVSAGAFLLVTVTSEVAVLATVMVLLGLGLGVGQPLTLAWVADIAPSGLRGTALGMRLSGNRLGQLVVPAVMGVVGGAGGIAVVFVATAGVLTLGAASVILVGRRSAGDSGAAGAGRRSAY